MPPLKSICNERPTVLHLMLNNVDSHNSADKWEIFTKKQQKYFVTKYLHQK